MSCQQFTAAFGRGARVAAFGLIAFSSLLTAPTSSVARPCHDNALSSLKKFSPKGYAVYASYRNKKDFMSWVSDCEDVVGGLTTAVHETIHMLTEQQDGFPLINGGTIFRVAESPDFYPPERIARRFSASSPYVDSYLTPGKASSSTYFRYLLDEFNAYTHDLNTSTKLITLQPPDLMTMHRDGLAAFMAFIAAYVDEAKANYPRTWKALHQPRVRDTVYTLWSQAEDVMAGSCHLRNIASEAFGHLRRVCGLTIHDPLAKLLGRPPLCPVSCTLR